MHYAALVIPLLAIGLLPVAFGEIVETKGQNYDLVENFFIGEANWVSHPERIMDNGWQNYALTNSADKVIFNTNAVGSFVFDKNSCSYSIYGNGYNGEQIIPSVSAVATYLNNGQWQNLPINDEACTVTIDRYEDGVFLTSTKVITEDVTEDVFIDYTGTTENFYVNATNSQFTLISNSTGNVGYFNGETRVLESVEVEKFVQEIRLDIFDGYKETFKVWHDGSEELGISQTIHSETGIIEIADQVIDIASLSGTSYDRQFIIDNEAEILAITDNVNYDFDTGIDFLSNVNIIFDGDYKVNMDFSNGNFVGYLEIDPTITLSGTTKSTYASGGGSYSGSNSGGYVGGDGAWVYRSGFYWDISSISDSATITNTELQWNTSYSNGNSNLTCDVNPISGTLSTDGGSTIHADVASGTPFIDNGSFCAVGVSNGNTLDLGSSADSDLESHLSTDEWGIGIVQQPLNTLSLRLMDFTNVELQVTYSVPIAPNAPTNLSTVTGIPLELDWTAPVDNGGSAITGYKVFRTLNEFALTELPNSSGSDSQIDMTDNEFLIHGFEIIAGSTQNEAQNTDTFKRAYVGSGSGTSCPTGNAGVNSVTRAVWLDDSGSSGGTCSVAGMSWDISALPSDATVTGIDMIIDVSSVSSMSGVNGELVQMDSALSTWTDASVIFPAIQSETTQYYSGSDFQTTGTKTLTLNSNAVSDMNSVLSSGTWETALRFDTETRSSGINIATTLGNADLAISYTQPVQGLEDKSTNSISVNDSGNIVTEAVVWDSSTASSMSSSGNTFTSTAQTWSSIGSTETITLGDGVEFTSFGLHSHVGFGSSATGGYANSQFDLYANNGSFEAYENGSFTAVSGSYTNGDTLALKIDSTGTVKAYHNGAVIHTYTGSTASGNYYVIGAGYLVGDGANVNILRNIPATSTTGVISTGVQSPNLSFTDSNLPDGTDDFSVGSWVKLDSSITYEDDLSSYTTQSSADTAWVSADTSMSRVNISTDELDFNLKDDGTHNGITYDLGSVSDDSWVLRFKMTTDTLDEPSAFSQLAHIGISSLDSATQGSSAQDFIGLEIYKGDGASASDEGYYTIDADNANLNGAGNDKFTRGSGGLSTETVWVEIKRESSTSFTVSMYSDSNYSTLLESKTSTTSSNVSGLQYLALKHQTNTSRNADIAGTLDDIEFYNGVTSTDVTNTKLLQLNDVTFNVGTTSASVDGIDTVNYKVHSFTSSSNFQITSGSGNVDYLMVAGGGGGGGSKTGNSGGGGGGAGGMLQNTASLSSNTYSITVGQGGTGGIGGYGTDNGGCMGNDGTDSTFNSLTAIGGGGGGAGSASGACAYQHGQDGGSGGGEGGYSKYLAPAPYYGVGTSGQGNDGGSEGNANGSNGGGGGAGSSGTDGTSATSGSGGDGLSSSITGTATFYAGGGGSGGYNINAGTGGSSIGGDGGGYGTVAGSNAVANTGSGGGGSGIAGGWALQGLQGGSGSDGIVIVRYVDDGSITATGGTVTTMSSQSPITIINANGLSDNTSSPQHYVFTRDGNDWEIYQNGVSEATATDSTSLGANTQSVITELTNGHPFTATTAGYNTAIHANTLTDSPVVGDVITGGKIYIGSVVGDVRLGLYDDNGSGAPQNLLAETAEVTASSGWFEIDFVTPYTVTSTDTLHLAMQITGATSSQGYAQTGATQTYSGAFTQGAFPSTFPSFTQTNSISPDLRAVVERDELVDYTTNISGMTDEYFINSDVLTSSEVDSVYERGVAPTLLTTVTATEHDDSTVVGGNDYYYSVKATNAIGDSDFLTPFVNGLAGTPPGVPTGVSTAINNPNTTPLDITVSWSAPTNVGSGTLTGFEIYRDGVLVDTVGLVSSVPNTVPSGGGTFVYSMKAVSTHGTSGLSGTSSITTPSIPDTPAAPTGSINDPNGSPLDVTVSWVAPNAGGSAITNYDLYRSSTSGSGFTIVQAGVTGLTHTDTTPSAGTWYYTVAANNLIGSSAQSPELSVSTPSVPSAISDLAGSTVSDTAINLTWSAPNNGGSNIIDYSVYRDGVSIDTVTTPGYSDTGLTQQTSYTYTVYARNNVGTSLISNSVSQETHGVPAVVPSFQATSAALDAITLSWGIPNDYNSAITNYVIERESPIGGGFQPLTTVGTVTTYSDTELIAVTEYNYRIKAVNAYGNSPTTTASTITLPAPPTNVFVTPSSSTTELTISWDEPTLTTGITGYQLQREIGIGNGFTAVTTTSGTSHLDTGLTTNIFYNYRLVSVSVQGNSDYSNTYAQTTFHLPDPVTVLSATAGTVADVTLDWDAPAIPYAAILGYTIYNVDAPGTTASATATLSTTLDQVSSITINDGGTQYSVAPTVTISAPTGQLPHVTATATAAITNGVVTSVSITNNGDGYNTIPTITLTSPSVNTAVSGSSTLTPYIVDTGDITTSRTITGLEPSATHNFAIAPITIHGSSIQNAAIVSISPDVSFEGIVIDMPDEINPSGNVIQFMKTQVGNNTNLTLEYDAALDITCETTNPFSATTNTYPNLAETSLGNGKVTHTIAFNDSQNNIVDVMCYDVNDPTIKGQQRIQQNVIPLKDQMDDFNSNTFGTGSSFAAIDLMTLIVVIVGMIGFNRKNPAVGLALMAGLIGILSYFQVITLETSVISGFTLVVFLAIAMGLKRS